MTAVAVAPRRGRPAGNAAGKPAKPAALTAMLAAAEEAEVEWLRTAPLPQLFCRDLRHAWPRPPAEAPRGRRGRRRTVGGIDLPPDSEHIDWTVDPGTIDGAPLLRRTMWCIGGCGVRRVERFISRAETLMRVGAARLRYPKGYGRPRIPDVAARAARKNAEEIRGSVVARCYPGFRW